MTLVNKIRDWILLWQILLCILIDFTIENQGLLVLFWMFCKRINMPIVFYLQYLHIICGLLFGRKGLFIGYALFSTYIIYHRGYYDTNYHSIF